MIAQLIALGVFSAAAPPTSGVVNVPDERTALVARVQASAAIAAGIPLGAVEWEQPYDPADHARYAFSWATLLEPEEQVAEILAIRVSSAAAALGIMVDQSLGHSPLIDSVEGRKVQLWFVVAEAMQEAATFLGAGVKIPITMKILTTLGQTYERTNVLTVRQL